MEYLVRKYYQKSFCVLYPFLGLKRDDFIESVCLENTYLSWSETNEGIGLGQLILKYVDLENEAFIEYQEKYLIPNERLVSIHDCGNSRVFVFDLIDMKEELDKFMDGKYSKFTKENKTLILRFWGWGNPSRAVENSPYHVAFNPEYYFELAAEELGYTPRYLRRIGELWNKPDLEREHLVMSSIEQLNPVL